MKRNRMQLMAICAFAVVLVFATVATAQNAKVDGTWNMTLQAKNGPQTHTLIFTSDGGKLAGTMKAGSKDIPVTGTIDSDKISFTFSPHGDASVTFNGTVDGDSMKGTARIGETDRDWTATRSKT